MLLPPIPVGAIPLWLPSFETMWILSQPLSLHSATQRREKGHALPVFAVRESDSFPGAVQQQWQQGQVYNVYIVPCCDRLIIWLTYVKCMPR